MTQPTFSPDAGAAPQLRPERRQLLARIGQALTLPALAALAAPAQAQEPGGLPRVSSGVAIDAEREELSRIAFELERLEEMVVGAARHAPSGQRISFQYEWLKRDLELVRRGIAEHLDAPRQPRPVPPLRGEYRQ